MTLMIEGGLADAKNKKAASAAKIGPPTQSQISKINTFVSGAPPLAALFTLLQLGATYITPSA
jgi:hypothetical protein